MLEKCVIAYDINCKDNNDRGGGGGFGYFKHTAHFRLPLKNGIEL